MSCLDSGGSLGFCPRLRFSLSPIIASGRFGAVSSPGVVVVVFDGWTGLRDMVTIWSIEQARFLTWARLLMELRLDCVADLDPPVITERGLGYIHRNKP